MVDPAVARRDFDQAADAFLALVARVPDDAWEQPGLGVWTVRELVGHTTRAFTTIELSATARAATLVDAVAYFGVGRSAGITNSEAVADRGREAGRGLGPDPRTTVRDRATAVRATVDAAPDDAVVVGRLGVIRLVDYLPTRTFELVVHGLDLQAALGLPHAAPTGPLAACLRLATDLAGEQGLGPALLLALTGRRPLPADTCVL